ncbi:MAG: hypothetical protein HOW73_46400 [Polyangiaceae bacterium]|nr:hypothetical protein [Polyangiaceae bacterium]
MSRLAGLGAFAGAFLAASFALAQPADAPPDPPAQAPPATGEPAKELPPPSDEPWVHHPDAQAEPPPAESIDETSAAPPASEAIIDERRTAPEEPEEPFCTSCVLIGVGAVVLIGTIPLAARLDRAIRRRDRMRIWLDDMGGPGADVGFIAGYGIAKADEEERNFAIATGIVGGVGFVVLAVGVGMVAAEGGFMKGPKEKNRKARLELGDATISVAGGASPEGGAVAVDVTF